MPDRVGYAKQYSLPSAVSASETSIEGKRFLVLSFVEPQYYIAAGSIICPANMVTPSPEILDERERVYRELIPYWRDRQESARRDESAKSCKELEEAFALCWWYSWSGTWHGYKVTSYVYERDTVRSPPRGAYSVRNVIDALATVFDMIPIRIPTAGSPAPVGYPTSAPAAVASAVGDDPPNMASTALDAVEAAGEDGDPVQTLIDMAAGLINIPSNLEWAPGAAGLPQAIPMWVLVRIDRAGPDWAEESHQIGRRLVHCATYGGVTGTAGDCLSLANDELPADLAPQDGGSSSESAGGGRDRDHEDSWGRVTPVPGRMH